MLMLLNTSRTIFHWQIFIIGWIQSALLFMKYTFCSQKGYFILCALCCLRKRRYVTPKTFLCMSFRDYISKDTKLLLQKLFVVAKSVLFWKWKSPSVPKWWWNGYLICCTFRKINGHRSPTKLRTNMSWNISEMVPIYHILKQTSENQMHVFSFMMARLVFFFSFTMYRSSFK